MQWLVQIFNKIYLNLAKFFGGLGVFVFAVMFIMLSAQYLGDRISGRIISNRSVVFSFVFSKEDFDDVNYYNFAKQMLENETLKRNNVKVRIKKYSNDKKIIDSSFDVIVTKNKALMEKVKDLTEKLAKAEGEINKRRNKDREDMIKQYKQL